MTQTYWKTALVVLLGLVGVERAQAQVGWGGYGFNSRAGLVGPTPWMMGPRAGLYGGGYGGYSNGPRSVTWYAPGLGYSSNPQTGLPWHGEVVSRPPRAQAPSSLGEGNSIARQERAKRRLETLYALRDVERQRRRDLAEREEMLAASAKQKSSKESVAAPAVAQKSSKSRRPVPPLLVDIQPTREVPFERRTTPGSEPTVTSPASATEPATKD